MAHQEWKLWEPAPAGRAPLAGRWRGEDGTPLHGVWGRASPAGTETVVVANHGHALLGWQVPHQRWRFVSELLRTANCALAQVPWLWHDGRRVLVSDPADVAVGLVLAGRKPVALADTTDPGLANRWDQAARAAGHAVRCSATTFDCGPAPTTVWFVQVAAPGTVAERFDVDALLADYAACLPPAAFAEVEATLDSLRDAELPELAEDPDLIMACTPGQYARTGLVLGYHPATTAGLILGLPRVSWADDPAGRALDTALTQAAAPAALPDLPSSLEQTPASQPIRASESRAHYAPAPA